jgi:hypothetical protein
MIKVVETSQTGMGEAVRELKSDTSESYDLKAFSEIAIENEAFSSKNSLKNAVEYRDNFQSVSSRHLENEFSDGLGGIKGEMQGMATVAVCGEWFIVLERVKR